MSGDRQAPSPSPDDGRSLWWMIPAAVASVLGIAAATIVRTRRHHEDQAVPALPPPDDTASSAPPLADLPPDSPAPG
ncbi:MAG: hypothetical protein WBA46_09010 [Thermomicrobiales bacterium]